MILRFVVKAFEEESSLLLPEVYDRYKLLLHKNVNDLNIVIDSDKDMSKLFGLMSDDLPKVVNGNFLKHLHHLCILDDQGFSFLVHNTIKLCQEQILVSSCLLRNKKLQARMLTSDDIAVCRQNF
jgi:hypothetical protein